MLNVMVLFGSKSVEHDISIITGVLSVNTMDGIFNVIPVYISKNGEWLTDKRFKSLYFFKKGDYKKCKKVTFLCGSNLMYEVKRGKLKNPIKIDCALNCTHGVNGEDGMISALCQSYNVPIASPDAFCSSFAMDKERTKIVLKGLGIKYLPYVSLTKREYSDKVDLIQKIKPLNFPVIVKPASLGSSIGITLAKTEKELSESLKKAFKYDDKVIIEKALSSFTEINCALYYDGQKTMVSECEKCENNSKMLSFSDKYERSIPREFPAKIDKILSDKIKKISKKIYEACRFRGIIRIDYLIDKEQVFVNEINTVPGSLGYYLFCDTFSDFSLLLEKMCLNAIKEQKENLRDYNYISNVLNGSFNNKK